MNKKMIWILFIGLILILVIASFVVSASNKKAMIRNAERIEDKIQVQYDLDGVAKVSVPKSFAQNTRKLIKKNWHYLDFSGEHFTYSFNRDAWNHIGGESVPVSLGIRFYKSGSVIPMVNEDGYEYGTFVYYGFQFTKIDDSIQRGKTTNPNPLVETFKKWGLLVYTDPANNFRVYMNYWDTYLTDDAALTMFNRITLSIVQENTLDARILEYEKIYKASSENSRK